LSSGAEKALFRRHLALWYCESDADEPRSIYRFEAVVEDEPRLVNTEPTIANSLAARRRSRERRDDVIGQFTKYVGARPPAALRRIACRTRPRLLAR